jgi:hypothetical protein
MVVIPRLSYQMESKSQTLKNRALSFSVISWIAWIPVFRVKKQMRALWGGRELRKQIAKPAGGS